MRLRLLCAVLFGVVGSLIGTGAETATAQSQSVEDGQEVVGADTVTVDSAVRRALAENPTIRGAEQQASAAAASVREARSGWFPRVQGQASYRRLSDNVDYTVDLPSGPGLDERRVTFAPAILDRYSVQGSVEQPIFTGFRVSNKVDAAHAQTRARRAQVEVTRQQVAFDTRRAYWRLYRAQTQARAADESLRLLERRLTDVKNRHKVGQATQADVLRVKARRDRVRAERIQVRNEVKSARRALNDQMDRPLDAPVVLADSVTLGPPPSDRSAQVGRAKEQRPDLRALRQIVQARGAALAVEQSGWYPQVSLTGSYLYARPNERLFPPEDRFQGTWEAGVTLSWSLSVGGQTDAAADRARARWQQARYELQDRRQAVTAEVKNQVEAVGQARAAVRAAQTSLQSAQAAHRAVQSRFEEEMVVVSDLLDAERALRDARTQLADAQANYAVTRAALDRALGQTVDQK